MKKFFTILFTISLSLFLSLPLYAQEAGTDHVQIDSVQDTTGNEGEYTAETEYPEEETFEDDFELAERKPKDYTRQKWELGLLSNIGVGFDNDIMGTGEIFKKKLVIDVDKINNSLTDDGAHVNFDTSLDILHVDIKNIALNEGLWDFGFFVNADGGIGLNLPKDLFVLISKGNLNQDKFSGLISASGSVFASAGFSGAAQYKVREKNLRVGLKTSLFTPLVYVPKSGIKFNFDTKAQVAVKDDTGKDTGVTEEGIKMETDGNISVYTPFLTEDGGMGELKFGFDLSLEGEYELFDFLDVGAILSQIPFIPASLEDRSRFTLNKFGFETTMKQILDGNPPDFGSGDDLFEQAYDSKQVYAFRPMRFDVYGNFRPLALNSNNTHNPDLLVLIPNIGFSVDFAGEEGFFNTGIAIQTTLNNNMFTARLFSGYEEGSFKHELGIIFNLRAVELHLNAALRSPSFAGAFTGQGFGVNIGLCYGW